jgi:hypothetical protein
VISLDDRTLGTSSGGRSGVWPISLSGDGSVVAYRMSARGGADQDLQYWVIVNGKESPRFTYTGRPSLSRDGRVIAYRASLEEQEFIRTEIATGPVRLGDRPCREPGRLDRRVRGLGQP